VEFVRIVGDEVVRIETMKVGGEKIVRTDREVILARPDKDTEAKKEEEEVRPPSAPSLRRPGEDAGEVPRPSNGQSGMPPAVPTPPPSRPGDPGPSGVPGSVPGQGSPTGPGTVPGPGSVPGPGELVAVTR
jgi:hypothetical protein